MASPEDAPVTVALALSTKVRFVAGAAGLAAVVFGVIAIFDKHDGAATAVLLVTGAAFGLMAVTGYGITRIKAGDYEVALHAVKRAQLAHARGDEEGAESIVRSLVREPVPSAQQESRAWTAAWQRVMVTDAATYERTVLDIVVSALPLDAELREERAPLSGVDAFIRFPEGARIGIEIRAGTQFDLRTVADRMSAALAYARPPLAGLIVIVRARPDDRRAEQLRTFMAKLQEPVAIVAWDLGDTDDVIRNAVLDMIPHVR